MPAQTGGQTEFRRTDGTCLFSATPRGGGRPSGLITDERFTFVCLGYKPNEGTDRLRPADAEILGAPRALTTNARLKGDESMTIGSCHFRQRQVGEERSSKEVPGMGAHR